MANKSERLTVLSDAEQFALYGLPDFDDRQRLTYLSLSGPEFALASSRSAVANFTKYDRRLECCADGGVTGSPAEGLH